MNLGRCERTLKFRFDLQLCLGLRKPSPFFLCASFFDRVPRESREPASDGCSPVRACRSLAPPTSPATPNLRDICWKKETRTFYFLWSWKFVKGGVVAPRRASRGRLHHTVVLIVALYIRIEEMHPFFERRATTLP